MGVRVYTLPDLGVTYGSLQPKPLTTDFCTVTSDYLDRVPETRSLLEQAPIGYLFDANVLIISAPFQFGEEIHRQVNASGPFSGVGEQRSGQRFFFQ